jgi:sugar fermentation stimulation protein A
MRMPEAAIEARLAGRRARFSVEIEIEGQRLLAHLSNTGRLAGLLNAGTPCLVVPAPNPAGRLRYRLLLVRAGSGWVAVDTRLTSAVVEEALARGRLLPLRGYPEARGEVRRGVSRLDFLLGGPSGRCLLEVKSCTNVVDDVALFPDAPTARGARHLRELAQVQRSGEAGAAVLFLVQREDATCLRPNATLDPAFASAFYDAAAAGVMLLAYRCRVSPECVELADRVPVRL